MYFHFHNNAWVGFATNNSLTIKTSRVECRCHRNYRILLFSGQSNKTVLTVLILDSRFGEGGNHINYLGVNLVHFWTFLMFWVFFWRDGILGGGNPPGDIAGINTDHCAHTFSWVNVNICSRLCHSDSITFASNNIVCVSETLKCWETLLVSLTPAAISNAHKNNTNHRMLCLNFYNY